MDKIKRTRQAITYFKDAVEETDEIIDDCSSELKAELLEQKEYFIMALEIMRRQIPKKVRLKYETTYLCPPDCGGKENDEYGYVPYCPACDAELDGMPKDKYCRKCGQKLDWDK